MHATPHMPPFAHVIKSRDVEDPVNIWIERPLAYVIVLGLRHTSVTPNQVTVTAVLLGFAAAACWFVGGPTPMLVGGILLWSSSILDGADGILARAKRMQSELGRALDGAADALVAAVTVAAGFTNIWVEGHSGWHVAMMPVALVTAVVHIYLYDFYKECYLNSTNPGWDGITVGRRDIQARLEAARAAGASVLVRFAWSTYAGMLAGQQRVRRIIDPLADREGLRFPVTEETVRLYRRHNYGPMQLWSLVSLCPHTYTISICAMFNRLDVYLWIRFLVANLIFLVVIVWQRAATARTLAEMDRIHAEPRRISGDLTEVPHPGG